MLKLDWQQISKRQIIGFAGPAGTGKTTLMPLLSEALAKEEIDNIIFPSTTREFFASRGVKDVKEIDEAPEADRLEFQTANFHFYIKKTYQFLRENPGKVVLADRTIFDNIGYIVYNAPNELKLSAYSLLRSQARDYSGVLAATIHFPYPAHFSQDVDPDPFRNAKPGRNIAIGSIIRVHASDYRINSSDHQLALGGVGRDLPSDRVNEIMQAIRQWHAEGAPVQRRLHSSS